MKKIVNVVSIGLIALPILVCGQSRPVGKEPVLEVSKIGKWTISPFTSYRLRPTEKSSGGSQPVIEATGTPDEPVSVPSTSHDHDGRLGGGLEIGYNLSPMFTVALEALSENTGHSVVDEAGLNLKSYWPDSRKWLVTPYLLTGVSKGFEDDEAWRGNLGLGAEIHLGKRFAVWGDGRWTSDYTDDNLAHALFRLGGSLKF